MSGLELPSFIVGLTGLAAVFDKACAIWRTVAQAREYGEHIAKSMSKIEMEFFRFQAWWTVLETLAADPRNQHARSTLPRSSMIVELETHVKNPLTMAASNVVELLNELEQILVRNGVLKIAGQVMPAVVGAQTRTDLSTEVDQYRALQKRFAKDLLRSTSWFRRLKHDAAPWKSATDRTRISDMHDDFRYWNDNLYGILPHNIRESVLQQGIAGFILDEEENALSLSSLTRRGAMQNLAILEYTQLLEIRRETRYAGQTVPRVLQDVFVDMKRSSMKIQGMPTSYDIKRPFSTLAYKEHGSSTKSNVLIEWYSYPPQKEQLDTRKVTQQRIARLSYLLMKQNRPRTLHALDAIGFVENLSAHCFGLVSEIPNWSSIIEQPMTLHSLLSRDFSSALPSLEKKYKLAAILASTLYTFMLTRWHHKRYYSSSIYFLFSKSADNQNSGPDLSKPFVGGFAVSRPDAPNEDTFEGTMTTESEIYLHPDMRATASQEKPQFRRSFEVYGFSILLAEIGFWNVLPKIALGRRRSTQVSAKNLRSLLLEKCQTDLACWMGERYRDVTIRCLRAESTQEGGVGEGLNEFYWQVVLELRNARHRHEEELGPKYIISLVSLRLQLS